MPNPFEPLSYATNPDPRPMGPDGRDLSGDMIGGSGSGGGCGCNSGHGMKRGKVLLGLALLGAAAFAYREMR